MAYQDPHFDKKVYWDWRQNASSEFRKGVRALGSIRGFTTGQQAKVGDKPVSKKALRKNTKRARKLQLQESN